MSRDVGVCASLKGMTGVTSFFTMRLITSRLHRVWSMDLAFNCKSVEGSPGGGPSVRVSKYCGGRLAGVLHLPVFE